MFVDRAAHGVNTSAPLTLADARVVRATLAFPTLKSAPLRRLLSAAITEAARWRYRTTGKVSEGVFGPTAVGLLRNIAHHRPDMVVAHTIQALPAALSYCRRTAAPLIFDVFEYYSEMGDSQRPIESAATKRLERDGYRDIELLLATSDELADVLYREYEAKNVLVSLNVPPLEAAPKHRAHEGLRLYWRNSQVALSQRGLRDALEALPNTPANVELFIQGRPSDDIDEIQRIAAHLGVAERVHILPAFSVGDAVQAASSYDIGLCLEQPGPRNHELTISNKFFDYHMAGLAVISSDMPSLATALGITGGGMIYRAGSPRDLARAICALHADRARLDGYRTAARRFAETRGNLELELDRVSSAILTAATIRSSA
ncbi:glycosyltransferase [Thalassovita mediterranea]|nr:glycosyltransferase [Thalassovita mediterranea]